MNEKTRKIVDDTAREGAEWWFGEGGLLDEGEDHELPMQADRQYLAEALDIVDYHDIDSEVEALFQRTYVDRLVELTRTVRGRVYEWSSRTCTACGARRRLEPREDLEDRPGREPGEGECLACAVASIAWAALDTACDQIHSQTDAESVLLALGLDDYPDDVEGHLGDEAERIAREWWETRQADAAEAEEVTP